jgi:hypothetical protein
MVNRSKIERLTPPAAGDYRSLELTQGQVCFVSPHRFDELRKFKWFAKWDSSIQNFYAVRQQKRVDGTQRVVFMHRVILGLESGDPRKGDHKNRKRTLDNTDDNLRISTSQQQSYNTGKRRNNSSGYKGVFFEKRQGRFRSQIRVNGKRVHLGYRLSAYDAYVELYVPAANKLHGEFACVD